MGAFIYACFWCVVLCLKNRVDFFLYRTQGICPLGGDFERNDKKTEYNFVIIGQVASKSF